MIVAIANNKGGVAKTTIAVHFATWLARQGKKVLLVDLDTQGSVARFLGLPCRKGYFYGDENAAMPVLQHLGGVELYNIPRSGHGMMLDNPTVFYERLAAFFDMPR